jgi:arginine deiminase
MNSLNPGLFLFSESVDLEKAKEQHENFCNQIRRFSNAQVMTVRNILLMGNDGLLKLNVLF